MNVKIPNFRDSRGNVWMDCVLSDGREGDGERFMAHFAGQRLTLDEVAAERAASDQRLMAARDATKGD